MLEQQARPQTSPPGHLPPESPSTGLDITVRTGSGSGRTLPSALDHALRIAGVADFTLVAVSSVIPPSSRIRTADTPLEGGAGDVLYCARVHAFAEHPGDIAWAGLGWCVDESGGGLLVEHRGGSEQSVVEQIELSLADMSEARGGGHGPVHTSLASAHCVDAPVCAVVLAAYQVTAWDEPARSDPAPEPATAAEPADVHPVVPRPADRRADRRADAAPGIRVTVEKEVDFASARRFYRLYRETFGELETKSVARQVLFESEFMEEMLDRRVDKYVVWDENDEAIGMTTLTSELDAVAWISPAYFAHHFPEQYARNAIYYLGFTLVHPTQRRARVFQAMVERMAELLVAERAVAAWDVCLFNDDRRLTANAGRVLKRLADVTVVEVDRQTYYTGTFHGPRQSPSSTSPSEIS